MKLQLHERRISCLAELLSATQDFADAWNLLVMQEYLSFALSLRPLTYGGAVVDDGFLLNFLLRAQKKSLFLRKTALVHIQPRHYFTWRHTFRSY